MARHIVSTRIQAPAEVVYGLWTNLDRMKEWVGGVTKVTDLSGPVDRVGTTYTVWFGPVRSPTEVTAADPPHRFGTRFGNWVLRGTSVTTFEPDGDATRVTQSYQTVGRMSAVMAWLFSRGSYRGSFQGELEQFGRLAEMEAAHARSTNG